MKHIKPALSLLAFAIVVPELITGSTSVVAFFNPGILLLYVLGYGLPVLLIRELAVRYRIGLRGTILFGIAYGFLNEGLLAKTVLMHHALPVNQYDHYGILLGFSVPWAAGICIWHAFASVTFPIVFVHWFFPDARHEPWLRNGTAIAIGVIDILLCSQSFLHSPIRGILGTHLQLAVLLGTMLLLFALGFRFRGCVREPTGTVGISSIIIGASVIVPFLSLAAIAGHKAPVLLYFVGLAAAVGLYSWLLKRRSLLSPPAFLGFAVGWYIQTGATALLVIVQSNPLLAGMTAIIDTILIVLLWRSAFKIGAKE